ncbi:hypothetical protein Zmor_002863 [Zophobas morio]|uniref:Uncharacterized protein n=1 Tax=Zophobas morio TaxID=2755281 RepID=A0AA38HLX0_9CUCU|nr:hypothetical protein Zmor_002863 [Zophobas morio]
MKLPSASGFFSPPRRPTPAVPLDNVANLPHGRTSTCLTNEPMFLLFNRRHANRRSLLHFYFPDYFDRPEINPTERKNTTWNLPKNDTT